MMIKKIATVVTVILALFLGILLWSSHSAEQKRVAKYESLEDKLRPLSVKKESLEQQLIDLDKQYGIETQPKATVQMIFTDLDAQVYSVCYPILKEFGFTGVLAVGWNQMPGMEGLISVEQFQELLNEGWTICIKWDEQTPVKTWWPNLQAQLKALQVEAGTTMYFTEGNYTTALDSQLQKMGFSIVVHHGEETEDIIQTEEETGIWHVGAMGFMDGKPKAKLIETVSKDGNITYLIGFHLPEEKYEAVSFRYMMGYFDSYEANQELLVTNMDDARMQYRERQAEYEHIKAEEYSQAKALLQEELAAVEVQIDEIKTQEE